MSFQIHSNTVFPPIARNQIAFPQPVIPVPVIPTPPPATPAWISDWMELLLNKVAVGKLGPTVTTRWMFLAANMVYNSYQFVTSGKVPVDMSYWQSYDKGVYIPSSNEGIPELESWMETACQYFFPILIRTYMNRPLSEAEVNVLKAKHSPLVAINGVSMTSLKALLSSYMSARDLDGWKNTFTFSGTLPNGSNVIYADNSVDQDLNTLPEPTKWTPLKFGSSVKNYLTPEWGTANAGVLSSAQFTELLAAANELYPTDSQYMDEMKDVAQVAANLTPQQKMIAEYWAGGPGTVTPPGMWMVLMDVVIRSNGLTLVDEIRNYTIVAAGLYQAGICAWRLKREHLQARPVQIIRELEYGQAIDQAWNSQVLGQYWLPYQELNFVTPPFPDFLSGHSTFSSTCCKLFCYLLESDQVVLKNPSITLDIINKFSPILEDNTVNFSINSVFLMPKCSEVQVGVEPPTGVSLSWPTWSSMANSSGQSRIFGGIHVESSNQAGLYLGKLIADKIWNKFKSI